MSLKNHSKEKMAKMSLVELTKLVMLEENKPMKFNEAFDKVSELKGLTEEQKQDKIGQFYTDLNVDGNFVSNGSNTWGLKRWFRSGKKENEIEDTPRRVVKRRKRKTDDKDEDKDIDLELSMIDENIDVIHEDLEYDEELDFDLDEEYDDYENEED